MQSEKNLTLTCTQLKPSTSVFKKAIRTALLASVIGISFPLASNAQQNEVVTDQTVVQLVRAGISKQVIMAKIENSQTNFDLSTNGLVFLKNNGVPDDIVATMINKNSNNTAAPQQQDNGANPAQDTGDMNAQSNQADDPNAQANSAPPELPTYEQPPCPTDGYLWQPGYWAFNPINGYYWVPGVWVAPPQPGLLWTPGYWGFNGVVFVFHRGYWATNVGFYGGINYGYGYGGVGFIGGGWYGHVYRYNTAVVHVNTVVIHNVYVDRTVIHNTTVVNRTSFNGRGGVVAQPRPEELKAARETHVQATQEQIAHQREASNDKSQFAKENNGRPTQTASARVSETAIKNQQNYQQSHPNGDHFNNNNKGQGNNNNAGQPNSNGGGQGNGSNRAGNNATNPGQAGGNGSGNNANQPKTNNPNQPAGNGANGSHTDELKPNNPNQPGGNTNNNNNQKQNTQKKGGFFNNLRNNSQQHNQQQQRGGNNNNQQKQPREEKKEDKKH